MSGTTPGSQKEPSWLALLDQEARSQRSLTSDQTTTISDSTSKVGRKRAMPFRYLTSTPGISHLGLTGAVLKQQP